MESLLDLAPFSLWLRVHGSQLRVEHSGTFWHLTPRGNDQQTILHHETDRTDFLTRLGQEVLQHRWPSAKSSNEVAPAFSLEAPSPSRFPLQAAIESITATQRIFQTKPSASSR